MLLTKITIIGAGSASFRLNTATALLSSERLRGSHLTRWTEIPKRST